MEVSMPQLRLVAAVSLTLLVAVPVQAAQVTIDRTQRSQTIDGFGFFGAHDVWWGQLQDLVNTAWFDAVVDDLGITIWRNELPPPADAIAQQDADWTKMRPVVQAMSNKAKASGVPLKIILTVWSPPSSMKCVVGASGVQDGTPHPGGTKNGGGLCPSKRAAYADWLVAGLKQYADIGVEVYGLSFQNEPLFVEFYNSCVYNSQEYADTLAAIGPIIHAAYPKVKLFGSENMLAIECGGKNGFDPYWYTANVMSQPTALSQMGIWAVHGYSDGVLATPTSQMSTYWASFYAGTQSTRLPIWMTETSGYVDTIEAGTNASGDSLPGALDLAQSIYAALYHGHLSGWVWWQGSELGTGMPSEFDLMSSVTTRGKKYYVSKNYYRYVRPGAQMVQAASDDSEVLVAAFDHAVANTLTIIAINGGKASKSVTLTGANLPATFQAYRTSTTENCASVGPMAPASITLPARSITSLVFGDTSKDPGVGGAGGAGGSGGTGVGSGGTTGGLGGVVVGSGGTRASGGVPGGTSGSTGAVISSSGAVAGGGAISGSAGAAGGTLTAGAGAGGSTGNSKSGGGGCRVAGSSQPAGAWYVVLLSLLLVRRRRPG
jgi:O-glycosyl hydrolase